ncbi:MULTISPECIES: alpha/beta fold hydrolase [unclassified Pedobacter]|uniref:alpha/beta fold hydrolase n=1 Tax=unclassified Pedobacter TaxID=2628915 RepID=UPI001E38BD4F|nr:MULTISPECIES: alpha/beta hydrolase [unclassified Pedobacter]
MKKILLFILIGHTSLCSFAQQASIRLQDKKDDYNLDFESGPHTWKSSVDWQTGLTQSGYKVSIDSNQQHSGKYALLIENVKKEVNKTSGMSNLIIPSKFEGKEIEVKFYLKLADVSGHADFPIRIEDEDNDKLEFTNLLAKRIYGTQDWKAYRLKLPLPKEAVRINMFPLLYGQGKMWVDDIQILIDGVDIKDAKIKADYKNIPYKPTDYGNNNRASGKVKVKDAALYYETYGKGAPLLLLHGNSQSISVFKKQIKEYSKTYKVIAVDTRGQGKSTDSIPGPLSYDLYAEDMKTVLDSLNITKTNILGWSDGGNTGLIMASKYPEYVQKLAITGACTDPNKAVSIRTLKEVSSAIEGLKSKNDKQSAYQIKLFTMLLTEPHLSTEDLKKIKSPVLVMAGEKDIILEKHTKYIAANIPDAALFVFKGASHYVPVEKVSEFNKKVLEFFNQK